jgi:rhodanese-related sulfurtransferase
MSLSRVLAWATLVTLSLASAYAHAQASVSTVFGPTELSRLIADGGAVLDVRRSDEWRATGVIAGSARVTVIDEQGHADPAFVAKVLAQLDPSVPVAVICRSGNRSQEAARLLREEGGFRRVYNVDGGINAWLRGGGPVSPCPAC